MSKWHHAMNTVCKTIHKYSVGVSYFFCVLSGVCFCDIKYQLSSFLLMILKRFFMSHGILETCQQQSSQENSFSTGVCNELKKTVWQIPSCVIEQRNLACCVIVWGRRKEIKYLIFLFLWFQSFLISDKLLFHQQVIFDSFIF